MNSKPLLISGIHRSGSTWLSNMLTVSKDTMLIDEPFNIGDCSFKLGGLPKGFYTYIPDINEENARIQFQMVINNRTKRVFSKRKKEHWFPFMRTGRQIIKDPIAALSTEWLYKNFELDILILVRHPAAYVSSLIRMGWEFPFNHLMRQQALMEIELSPLKNEIMNVSTDFIDRAALSWKCIYFVLSNYIDRNNWVYKRHEDLAQNPVKEIKRIYTDFELEWNGNVKETIERFTGKSNPVKVEDGRTHLLKRDSKKLIHKWKGDLSIEQIYRIKEITSPVWQNFYDESDW